MGVTVGGKGVAVGLGVGEGEGVAVGGGGEGVGGSGDGVEDTKWSDWPLVAIVTGLAVVGSRAAAAIGSPLTIREVAHPTDVAASTSAAKNAIRSTSGFLGTPAGFGSGLVVSGV